MDIVKTAMSGELGQYRKYGAKKETQTRDSTRHYFRCKVDDCPSRKIVEVFTNGQHHVETRGFHNHPDNAPSGGTIPSKRSSEEAERPALPDEQSLTRSKRASAQNVSNVIRLVKTSSQQMLPYDHSSLSGSPRQERQMTPSSPRAIPSQGGSPGVGIAGPSSMQLHQFSTSPPPVAEFYPCPLVKPDAGPFARSGTPQPNRDSPHQSHTPGPRYANPEHRSFSPAVNHVHMDPIRADSGAISLATAPAVGPSQLAGHPTAAAAAAVAEPGPSVAGFSTPANEKAEDKQPMVALPLPLPAHPHSAPPAHSHPHADLAVGLPASIAAPARIVATPEPAPPTPATAAGTSTYPGHEGVAVNDPRVSVNEWRSEEGVLGLLFTGSEKEYSDAYCWRKYGKKSIKGHVMPRFYWRCTHKQCDIKRHTQATEDGRTEVRYYGRHCHSPPPHKTSRGRRTAGPAGPSGIAHGIHGTNSPRSGTAAASSGASPLTGAVAGGTPDGVGADSAQPSGARAGLERDARRRAVGARAMMASDDEYEDPGPPRQRQRRPDVDGGTVPPNLSRCPLYFLACVAANQAR